MDALTRGGPNGLPRPIELHAHDPQRYVGDMLAWVHQATAGEREFLESLFGVKDSKRMVGSVRKMEKAGEEEELVRTMLDRNLEGCCRPLRVRAFFNPLASLRADDDCIRFVSNTPSSLRTGSLCPTRSSTSCSSTSSPWVALLDPRRCFQRLFRSKQDHLLSISPPLTTTTMPQDP